MNDEILKELKIVVERAVRPVRATIARKCRMREELLAHLTAIFDEEAERQVDEQSALAQAKERFGDPRELTGQLQETVPRWDRLSSLGEAYSFRRGESLVRFAGRVAACTLLLSVVFVLIALPIVRICGRPSEFATAARVLFAIAILNVPLTVGFVLLADGMYRALFRGPSLRSWRLAAVYALVSIPFLPVIAFAWYWSLTGDLAASLTHLWFACRFAPIVPLLFALLAKLTPQWRRQDEEWASLQIEP